MYKVVININFTIFIYQNVLNFYQKKLFFIFFHIINEKKKLKTPIKNKHEELSSESRTSEQLSTPQKNKSNVKWCCSFVFFDMI